MRKPKSLGFIHQRQISGSIGGAPPTVVQHCPTLAVRLEHSKTAISSDEFGANLGMTRLYGRAAPGERVPEAIPGFSGSHYTVVAMIGLDGTDAPLIFEGAMSKLVFESYVEQMLAPTLRQGDIVVMDNLSSHKSEKVRNMIDSRGARLVFLPPYSPDLNPIEKCWSKVKTALRAAKARTFDALVDALAKALRSVSLADIESWFAHCGYAIA